MLFSIPDESSDIKDYVRYMELFPPISQIFPNLMCLFLERFCTGKDSTDVFMTELDAYLFGEGTHYEIYNKMGAHKAVKDGR